MIPEMMKAPVVRGQGQMKLETIPVPTVGPDDMLLKVEAYRIAESRDAFKVIFRP